MKNIIMKNARIKARNMTEGNIYRHLILFAVPLLIGNIFQLLYSTVDSVVVGRFIGTEALAAIGSTEMIINILIYFFMGFSVGAGVLIARCYGAGDEKLIHDSVETTISLTLILCVLFTVIGYLGAVPTLRLLRVPEEVLDDATTYLRIYFFGISGLLIYNIGGAVLRAVGNTMAPLYFLILSSIINIILDVTFVFAFGAGVGGVAWATVISQLFSAILILMLLTRTEEVYRLDWRDLHINKEQFQTIVSVGLPTGIQLVITGLANFVAQTYVNALGPACMAGWSCFNKLISFALLPMVSLANATTTFVSQNVGAKQKERTLLGIRKSNWLNLYVSAVISGCLFIFAAPLVSLFSGDKEVIVYGAFFIRYIVLSMIFYAVGNNVSVAMLGLKDSKIPTAIKLVFFAGFRVAVLYIVSVTSVNTPASISMAFSLSWIIGTIVLIIYFEKYSKRRLISECD